VGELFGEVLRLCDRAGLVKPGVVSIDGTRIAGNASPEVNHEFDRIAREIVAEARATDEAEDELCGDPDRCHPGAGRAAAGDDEAARRAELYLPRWLEWLPRFEFGEPSVGPEAPPAGRFGLAPGADPGRGSPRPGSNPESGVTRL
jgi:hypothetical protein